MNIYVAVVAVFVGFGVMSMAGLGAATLFIPIFYYAGIPLPDAPICGSSLRLQGRGLGSRVAVWVTDML